MAKRKGILHSSKNKESFLSLKQWHERQKQAQAVLVSERMADLRRMQAQESFSIFLELWNYGWLVEQEQHSESVPRFNMEHANRMAGIFAGLSKHE